MISGYFWADVIIKVLLVLVAMIGMALVAIYAELKVMSHMQHRIGPYYAGGRWGWAQPLADAVKFIQTILSVRPAAAARRRVLWFERQQTPLIEAVVLTGAHVADAQRPRAGGVLALERPQRLVGSRRPVIVRRRWIVVPPLAIVFRRRVVQQHVIVGMVGLGDPIAKQQPYLGAAGRLQLDQ